MQFAYYGDIFSGSPSVAQRNYSTYAPYGRHYIPRNVIDDTLINFSMPRHICRSTHVADWRDQ